MAMKPLEHKEYAYGLTVFSPTRCQATEKRWLNERNPKRRRYQSVQCGLKKHIEKIPHEYSRRTFATPSAKQKHHYGRCEATEVRTVNETKPLDRYNKRVRCTKSRGHEDFHVHMGRPFATPSKKRGSRKKKAA